MRVALASLAVLSLLLGACANGDDGVQGCEMRAVAEMPVLNDHGSPIIQVEVNGTKVAFIVDTGARTSLIFAEAADRLGLPTDPDHVRLLGGVGGLVFSRTVTVDTLSLGTAIARHMDLDSVSGGPNFAIGGVPVVGLFGGDFLANYDVEFDLPAHMVSLFAEHGHCGDNLRPWPAGQYYRQPFRLDNETAITFDIRIDGHKEPVVLDSGAGRTVIDSDAGHDSGATRTAMAADRRSTTHGIDGNAVETRRHRFDSLDIGPEHFAPAWLDVADIEVSGLLGADFFRTRRVWISYAHDVLYVQPVSPSRSGTVAAGAAPKH